MTKMSKKKRKNWEKERAGSEQSTSEGILDIDFIVYQKHTKTVRDLEWAFFPLLLFYTLDPIVEKE